MGIPTPPRAGLLCRYSWLQAQRVVLGMSRACSGATQAAVVESQGSAATGEHTPDTAVPASSRLYSFEYGDSVLVSSVGGRRHHRHLVLLQKGQTLQTHVGKVAHEDIIAAGPGGFCYSSKRKLFLATQPTVEELILEQPRNTTPTYPKDSAAMMMMLGLRNGDVVIEAGCGSGGFTSHLVQAVGPTGQVHSLDIATDRFTLWCASRRRVSRSVGCLRADASALCAFAVVLCSARNLRRAFGSDAAFSHVHFCEHDVTAAGGLPDHVRSHCRACATSTSGCFHRKCTCSCHPWHRSRLQMRSCWI